MRRNREWAAAAAADLMMTEESFAAFPEREVVGIRNFYWHSTDSIVASRSHAGVLIRWWSGVPCWYLEFAEFHI